MSTDKKKIEKRWCITIWHFNKRTGELDCTDTLRTKPMTEKRAREIAMEKTCEESACWKIQRAYR